MTPVGRPRCTKPVPCGVCWYCEEWKKEQDAIQAALVECAVQAATSGGVPDMAIVNGVVHRPKRRRRR